MKNEPKVRTKVLTRRGGDIVKTKTVTKGDGMKRVERTKTKIGQAGVYTGKSVVEKGPMGKSMTGSFSYKSKDGGSYGGAIEKIKAGGMKTKRTSSYDTFSEPAATYTMSGGKKVNVPAYTSTDKTSMVKRKGMGMKSKVVKRTMGESYDAYGNKVPSRTIIKSKKSK